MGEQDSQTFERHLEKFRIAIRNDADLSEFSQFFEALYAGCASSWAYCYRSRCGVNTNMHLERMHGIFKHIYQYKRKNKRLDTAIMALF